MNYRQWKKNYKKEHGYNPPLVVDKRKQRKLLKKTLKQAQSINITEIAKGIVNVISNAFTIIGETLSKIGEDLKQDI